MVRFEQRPPIVGRTTLLSAEVTASKPHHQREPGAIPVLCLFAGGEPHGRESSRPASFGILGPPTGANSIPPDPFRSPRFASGASPGRMGDWPGGRWRPCRRTQVLPGGSETPASVRLARSNSANSRLSSAQAFFGGRGPFTHSTCRPRQRRVDGRNDLQRQDRAGDQAARPSARRCAGWPRRRRRAPRARAPGRA